MAANPRPLLTEEEIICEYPLPIAHEYHELGAIDPMDWESRVKQLAMVFEVALRYCSAIALSQYYEAHDPHSPPGRVDQYVARRIADPTIEVCIEILRLTSETWPSRQVAFMPELCRFASAPGECLSPGLALATRLNSLVVLAHRLSPDLEGAYRAADQQYSLLVRQFVSMLDFLTLYKLLRALHPTGTQHEWHVNLLTGPNINPDREDTKCILTSIRPRDLGILSENTGKLLRLEPYALFRQCKMCMENGGENDFFLYEYDRGNRAIYLGLEDDDERLPHRIPLDSFIEEVEIAQRRLADSAEQSWSRLAYEMRARTTDQISHLREKYDKDLYIAREKLSEQYSQFTMSDSTGFLVIGDTGIGKTNLLCYLADEEENHDNIAVLENCASWDLSAVPALDSYLAERYGFRRGYGFIATLAHLDRSVPAHPRCTLFLDAINEFIEPAKLIDAIYRDLLLPTEGLNWFKVVLSCRSEAWTRMEGGFAGERRLFQSAGGVAQLLKRFDQEELRTAFEKYKKRFRIKTEFDELNGQAKRFMELPLMLRLVTETSSEKEIPATLESRVVFETYVKQKIGESNPRLEATSIREHRIVDRLVELMLEQTTDRLRLEALFDDKEIGALILDQSVGSPFERLLEKNVLLSIGSHSDAQLRFTYDQVFEFLLGERIFPLNPTAEELTELIQRAVSYPSLWGAIKFSLMARWKEDAILSNDELLNEIVLVGNSEVRSMITDALVTLAQQNTIRRDQVVVLISSLVKDNMELPSLLGIEIAHRIDAGEVLKLGACSDKAFVRQLATQYIFFMWQRDLETGTQIYQGIANAVRQQVALSSVPNLFVHRGKGLDTIRGFHALLDLSLLAVSLGYRYPEAARAVGAVLLEFIDAVPGWLLRAASPFLSHFGRSSILDTLENGAVIQIRSMRPFFSRPVDDPVRKECARVMQFKPHEGSLQGEMGDLIYHLAQEPDGFAYICCIYALMPRVAEYFESLYQFCIRLYDTGNLHSKYIALRVFTMTSHMETAGPYCRQEHIDFCNRMILDFLRNRPVEIEFSWKDTRYGSVTLKKGTTNHINYGCILELAHRRSGALSFIKQVQKLPWELPENERTRLIMQGLYEAMIMGVATSNINVFPILETASQWFKTNDPTEQESVVEALSYARSFFPAQTDSYLAEAPAALRVQVLTRFAPMPLGRIWNAGLQVGAPWLVRSVPKFYEAFSEEISRLALSATDPEGDLSELGARIANVNMIREIAETLKSAGKQQLS